MKTDLNLLPQKGPQLSGSRILIIALCILAVALGGVGLPLCQKFILRNKIDQLTIELASYSEIEVLAEKLQNQVKRLTEIDNVFTDKKARYLPVSHILNDIEANIPQNINIEKLSFSAEILDIEGTAPAYREIAQFHVKMQEVEYVDSVVFRSAHREGQSENNAESYRFSLHLTISEKELPAGGEEAAGR